MNRLNKHSLKHYLLVVHRSGAWVALAAALFFSMPPAAAQTAAARTLTIAGSAEVHSVPDAALVSTGVVSESETAAAALKTNSAALAKVIDAIRAAGVEPKDAQRSGLALDARY